MKTLKTPLLVATLFVVLGCSEDVEKKGADFHAQIADKSWTANKVTVSAVSSGDRAEVKKLVAIAVDGSSIEISFELLGLTPTQLNSSFREQTANLSAFTADYNTVDGVATVNWSTSSETNVDHFELMRSYDNYYFETVSYIYGHGTTNSPNSYGAQSWVNTDATFVYFKLRVYDYDYSYQDSQTLTIKLRSGASFTDEFGRRFHGYGGNIHLTSYDSKARTLSGNFSFKYLDANGQEHSVTDGHFERVAY
jgi:hypothetical protein